MIKRKLITIISVLVSWLGLSASENLQIVNLFEGDSLAQLSKEQIETLDFAINLLEENDSAIVLPKELGIMLGVGDSINIKSYPDWISAYFYKEKKKINLIVPTYAETPSGLIRSNMIIKCKKSDEYECMVKTRVSTNGVSYPFSGTYIESTVEGAFLKGIFFNKGHIVSEIKNKYTKTYKFIKPRFNSGKNYMNPYEQYKYSVYRTERWDLDGRARW